MTAKYRLPFLGDLRRAIRLRHFSIRTEESYVDWIKRFILFNGKKHPRDMGEPEVGRFLTHLVVERRVAASTQNQALNALVFLYKMVLGRALGEIEGVVQVKKSKGSCGDPADESPVISPLGGLL